MNWVEIKVKTSTESIEAISNIFYEAGVAGVVIEDPKDYLRQKDEDAWDYMDIPEEIAYEEAVVTAYLVEDSSFAEKAMEIKLRIKDLPKYGLNIGKGEVILNNISETNWAEAWKKYYKPTRIGKDLVIKPSWEDYCEKPGDIVIEMDPGMAFGTGTHETTVMCLELLEKYVTRGHTVIDVGCGSGILSIAAAKLGAHKVIGIDKDEVAVRVARENVERNNTNSIINIMKADKLHNVDIKADIIVANIIADVVIELSSMVPLYLTNNGIFLASGIIKDRKMSVVEALEKNGFDLLEEASKGEWVTLASTQAPINI
jgi:ribosomal protein L11 methyltransferase